MRRTLLGLLAVLAFASPAAAAPGVVTEFSAGVTPNAGLSVLVKGPDGNLWFTEFKANRIGRVSPTGVVREYSAGISKGAGPAAITTGPDGSLWFTEFNADGIGRLDPATGVISEFSTGITHGASPNGITAGPDGKIWFTEYNTSAIGRLDPSTQEIVEFSAGVTAGALPWRITAGGDGNLWFTEGNLDRIGRITPDGVVTEFGDGITSRAGLSRITTGPDGNVWFTESSNDRIGQITPAGVVTEFSAGITAGAYPNGIAAAPDGNIWFSEGGLNTVGRLNPSTGAVTEFGSGITPNAGLDGVTAGADGNLWFAEVSTNRIGRMSIGLAIGATEFGGLSPSPGLTVIERGPDGALWFTENYADKIGRIDSAGTVREFDMPATGRLPLGIATGADGNIWFTEYLGNTIARLEPSTGTITEVPQALSPHAYPNGIVSGPDGALWFCEQGANRIGRIDPTSFAITEFSDGLSPGADPWRITAGPDGNLWFTESGVNRIGRITPAGVITEFDGMSAGAGASRITAGPDGNVWFTESDGSRIGRITPDGVISEFSSGLTPNAQPSGIAAGADGNLWFAEGHLNQLGLTQVGRIDPVTGSISEFSSGITAGAGINGIVGGADGNLWFTEETIGKIGRINTGAGVGAITEFGDGITHGAGPLGIVTGPDDALWFTEYQGNRIGRLDPDTGAVTEYSDGMSPNSWPMGIALGSDGNLWFAENTGNRIGRIEAQTGTITEYSAGLSPSADPWRLTLGPDGNIWFTEGDGTRIGRITPAGVITEFSAGLPANPFVSRITAGPDGNLWFSESDANRIGRITPNGVITDYPIPTPNSYPAGIATGPDGNVWFAEKDAGQMARIDPVTGVVTEFRTQNTPGAAPNGLTAGADGNIWFTESVGGQIGRIDVKTGAVTWFKAGLTPNAFITVIEKGPDGNLWFTENATDQIGRVTTDEVGGTGVGLGSDSCRHRLTFGIVQVTTAGCLRRSTTNHRRYETTDAARVNGIPLKPLPGKRLVVTLPSPASPGGSITVGGQDFAVGPLTVSVPDINWKLPEGKQGDEATVTTLTIPGKPKLAGLTIGGSIALHLGFADDGTHYATFPINVQLPDIIKSGPSKESGGITATGAIKFVGDPDGGVASVRFDGMKLEVANVWIGSLQVESACFSYAPAFSQSFEPCEKPTLTEQSPMECGSSIKTDRFDGSAVVVLPMAEKPKLSLWGGVADNKLAYLGGKVDDLGRTVPIAEGVYLTKMGVEVCLGPPLKIAGLAGVSALPLNAEKSTLAVDGSFRYIASTPDDPWSLHFGGAISAYDIPLGNGTLDLRPSGMVDFSVNSGFSKFGVSVTGLVTGWIDTPRGRFTLQGSVTGCVPVIGCADAQALISSVGIAGCIGLGTIDIPYPVVDSWIPWKSHWGHEITVLRAGFGYRWGASSPDLLGNSCDVSRYAAARGRRVTARWVRDHGMTLAQARVTGLQLVDVPVGAQVLSLRVHGTTPGAAPSISVVGPDGSHFVVDGASEGSTVQGQWTVVNSAADGMATLIVVHPAAGPWQVEGTDADPIAAVDQAAFQTRTVAHGIVVGSGAKRTLRVAYSVEAGSTVSLVERAKGISHVLGSVKTTACPHQGAVPAGQLLRCGSLVFAPAAGPGGTRKIVAIVTTAGVAGAPVDVVTFKVKARALPARPGTLGLVRSGTTVKLVWKASVAPRFFTISVTISDGRKLAFNPAGSCRGLLIPKVGKGLKVTIRIAGVRDDLIAGTASSLTIAGGKRSAGNTRKLPSRFCR